MIEPNNLKSLVDENYVSKRWLDKSLKTASISGLVCATYRSTFPHNPLILTRPEDSPYGQPSLSTFAGKSFLSGQKNPRFHIGNR